MLTEHLRVLTQKRLVKRRLSARGVDAPVSWTRHDTSSSESDENHSSKEELRSTYRRLKREIKKQRRTVRARVDATLAEGCVDLPLESLAREHDLCEFEKLTIALVIAPSLDNDFEKLISELNGYSAVEIRTVLDVLCGSLAKKIKARRHFVHTGSLLGKGLISMSWSPERMSEDDFMTMVLVVPRRVSSLILGEYDIDDQLIRFSSVVELQVDLAQVVLPEGRKEEILELLGNRDEFLSRRKEWGFDHILSYGKGVVMLFAGPSGTGKTMLAHGLAKATGHRLMLVDLGKILNYSPHGFEENLARVFHEARLQRAILFFDEAEELFEDRTANCAMPTLLREIEKLDGIAILATNRGRVLDEALNRRILYTLNFEVPSAEQRQRIWQSHLPAEAPIADDVDLAGLAEEFELTGGLIKNAVLVALHRALVRKGSERRIRYEDLRSGARLQLRRASGEHLERVASPVRLSDVVLPADVRAQVEAVVASARHRATVFTEWGFAGKLSTGKALSVLFIGESGVGKTMTAEAIAHELGAAIYRVSVPSVISKWVGETEKNLASVFAAAREAHAVLFFDEADALFGSRRDGGNSHAYYINQQIATLLTETEKSDGLIILATNRPEAFDRAFERRIRHRITFSEPDAAAREAIWRGLIPSNAPLASDVDFRVLAREYALTGGAIKNVVLRAAFAAARNGGEITQDILRRSADEERPLHRQAQIGFVRREAAHREL